MPRFYFTYGTEGHPFYGGWTVVEAPSYDAAVAAFQIIHPNDSHGCLNCNMVYDEDHFMRTQMAFEGSFGFRCHEVITLQHTLTNARAYTY